MAEYIFTYKEDRRPLAARPDPSDLYDIFEIEKTFSMKLIGRDDDGRTHVIKVVATGADFRPNIHPGIDYRIKVDAGLDRQLMKYIQSGADGMDKQIAEMANRGRLLNVVPKMYLFIAKIGVFMGSRMKEDISLDLTARPEKSELVHVSLKRNLIDIQAKAYKSIRDLGSDAFKISTWLAQVKRYLYGVIKSVTIADGATRDEQFNAVKALQTSYFDKIEKVMNDGQTIIAGSVENVNAIFQLLEDLEYLLANQKTSDQNAAAQLKQTLSKASLGKSLADKQAEIMEKLGEAITIADVADKMHRDNQAKKKELEMRLSQAQAKLNKSSIFDKTAPLKEAIKSLETDLQEIEIDLTLSERASIDSQKIVSDLSLQERKFSNELLQAECDELRSEDVSQRQKNIEIFMQECTKSFAAVRSEIANFHTFFERAQTVSGNMNGTSLQFLKNMLHHDIIDIREERQREHFLYHAAELSKDCIMLEHYCRYFSNYVAESLVGRLAAEIGLHSLGDIEAKATNERINQDLRALSKEQDAASDNKLNEIIILGFTEDVTKMQQNFLDESLAVIRRT